MIDSYWINGMEFVPFIGRDVIDRAIDRIATEINRDYKGRVPVFLVVLNGAIFFAADLIRKIDLDCQMLSVRAKSYGQSMTSSGQVSLALNEPLIRGRDIIIVEDIIDNGYTINKLAGAVRDQGAASVETASLLTKPKQFKVEVDIKYTGLEIPPGFVIGFGLDYAEMGRNLPALYTLKP